MYLLYIFLKRYLLYIRENKLLERVKRVDMKFNLLKYCLIVRGFYLF